jgi:hypothetical protein
LTGNRLFARAALILLFPASVCLAQPDPENLTLQGPAPPEPSGPLKAIGDEAKLYLTDTKMILTSPLRWEAGDWARAGALAAAMVVLGRNDESIDLAVQKNRSSKTDEASSTVTPFGSYAAVAASVAALGSGWLLHDDHLRDTGRDAIEAEIIAAGIVTPLLKTITGRLRPSQGSDADEFKTFSGSQSFPSGHATEAFAVASVFSARSQGWVVPVVSYSLASMVGLARIHDRAHFASDVFAGAMIGTTIGRSIVHRHTEAAERASWEVVPVAAPRGAGLAIRIGVSPPAPPELPEAGY